MTSPYAFDSTEAEGYPGLASVPVRLLFPHPFTLGDYKTWFRAQLPTNDDATESVIIRLYRGAMSVATLEDIEPDGDLPSDPVGFSRTDLDPDDPELPMAFSKWAMDCADKCIAPRLSFENVKIVLGRRQKETYLGSTFSTADYTNMFPDLAQYPGTVTFKEPFTQRLYKQWQKSGRILPKVDPSDIDNSVFVRQFRAAIPLIESWNIEGVSKNDLRQQDGNKVPLEIVSWLVEVSDSFLAKRVDLKKMLGLSAII